MRSILGHKNFRDSDWSADNPQLSSEPIGESCTLLGDMLLSLGIAFECCKEINQKRDKFMQIFKF